MHNFKKKTLYYVLIDSILELAHQGRLNVSVMGKN